MSLAQHQNTCPIILRSLATEGRSTKAFLVSTVQNFPPLPPSLPPPLVFFPSPFQQKKTMNGIIGRVQLSKNAEMHARTSFFLFLPRSLAMGTEGGGSSGRAKGEGRDVAIFFNEELQGAMHASNKPPFRGERNRCVLIASFHACIIRLHASRTTGREYRIYSRYSIKAGLWIIIDISIFRSRRFEKFRKIERKREERYVDLLSFREFKNKKILLLILSKLFFFFL